jgi:hypothetical protein
MEVFKEVGCTGFEPNAVKRCISFIYHISIQATHGITHQDKSPFKPLIINSIQKYTKILNYCKILPFFVIFLPDNILIQIQKFK